MSISQKLKELGRCRLALIIGWISGILLIGGWFAPFFEIEPFARPSEKPGLDGMLEDLVGEVLKTASSGGGKMEFSLLGGIGEVFTKDVWLGLLLAFFSLGFPFAKLTFAVVALHWQGVIPPKPSWILKLIGPWSLLDALVVAILVIASKGLPFGTEVTLRSGFFFFVTSIFLGWISTFIAPTEGGLVSEAESDTSEKNNG